MKAGALLQHAAAVVDRRRTTYGDPGDLFERVAARWSQTLGVTVTPAQAVLCLLDLKLVRLSRDPKHADSIADLAGYAGILEEVQSDG
jgi:hypothetical protein